MERFRYYARMNDEAAVRTMRRFGYRGYVFPRGTWCAIVFEVSPAELPLRLDPSFGLVARWARSEGDARDGWSLDIEIVPDQVLTCNWTEYDDDHQDILRPTRYFRCWNDERQKVATIGEQVAVVQATLGLDRDRARELIDILRSTQKCASPEGPTRVLELLELRPLPEALDVESLPSGPNAEFIYVAPEETSDEAELAPNAAARRLLAALVDAGAIKLAGHPDTIAADLADALTSDELDASTLASALLDHDGIDDIFWTDDELARFLAVW